MGIVSNKMGSWSLALSFIIILYIIIIFIIVIVNLLQGGQREQNSESILRYPV
jgi:cbb3-type cytochrome oxidase subunit 3